MRAARIFIALALVLAAAPCRAQFTVDPDRPDITNGTHIVPPGLFQIELGGTFAHGPGASDSAFGSPFTARFGLLDWLEARIGSDGFLTQRDESGRSMGVGNTQIAAKVRLWVDSSGEPVLSILPTVNVPTASADKGLGSGRADYTLAALTGTDFGAHGHVDLNYGIGAIGGEGDGPRFVQHLVSVSASVAVTENWNPYLEAFWFSRQDAFGTSVASIDGGAIYRIGARYAVDGGVQVGVTANAPRFAVFAGLSFVVGDLNARRGMMRGQQEARAPTSTFRAGRDRD
jgi:hypothetical protein